MSIRQWDRREALRGELLDLIVEMMALGRTAEGQNTPEFRRLDQELTEKNAELEALNALCSDPNELRELKYRRSVRESHDFLRVIQIFLIVALFACLFFLSEGLRGSSELLGIAVFGLLYSCVSASHGSPTSSAGTSRNRSIRLPSGRTAAFHSETKTGTIR
ncbi:MAG: hypothetical protein ACLR0P_13050 [Oscillospiraceae bacterium]